MRTVGIIVEYNPLHNGHVYHFHQSKIVSGADAVVAVMSGHFLQRGEPAVVNKWARTEMALHMGVDVVVELPVAYSSQPAEWFAYGAVSALESTGAVDCLCFGSEIGDTESLKALARQLYLEPQAFRQLVKKHLAEGINYPAAYSRAVQQYAGDAGLLHAGLDLTADQLAQPNNILGLHYLIALERLGGRMEPYTIARTKAGYHQQSITDRQIASATAIRKLLLHGGGIPESAAYVPASTLDVLLREWDAGRGPVTWECFRNPLLQQIVCNSADRLAGIYEVTEGLEYRLKQAFSHIQPAQPVTVESLLEALKTKRYTRTKLQRMLLRVLLNHTKEELRADVLRQGVPYLRVLGFTDKGRQLLSQMKKTAKVPIVTKVTNEASPLLELDLRATSVYALGYRNPSPRDMLRDYYEPPIYWKGSE